jgi:hypothetical protein
MAERVRYPPSSSEKSPVRGRPFKHGNPGRPPGSKNKTTKILEELVEGKAEKLIEKLIELALDGDVRCLQYCVDRLLPRRRSEPINLELPKINGVNDIPPAMAAVTEAVSNGYVTPDEGAQVTRLLDSYTNAFIAGDVAVRLEKVESVIEVQDKKKSDEL